MDKWIRDLIASSVYGIKKLADAAIERIAVVYSLIVAVGTAVRGGWARLLTAFYFVRDKLGSLAREYYVTMWYIINVRIPAVISHTTDVIIRYLTSVIVDVANRVTNAINTLTRWVSSWIDRIVDNANRLADWALQQVNRIIDVLERMGALVFTLLTDPRRLAKWVLAALVMEAVQFASDNADALLDAIRKRSIAYAGRAAERIEEVLVRML